MRFARLSSLIEYTTELLKKFNELNKVQSNIYRIADVKVSSDKVILLIQYIGKSAFLEFTPNEIAADDCFLEGFSKKDIRTITYYACQQEKKFKYAIVTQTFCHESNKLLFKLKNAESNEILLKTAGEISLDKKIIANLSQEDVLNISYIAGLEHSDIRNTTQNY